MAEFAQQRPRLVDRGPLRSADPCRQKWWHLGAQRDSQSSRFTGDRLYEASFGGGRRRCHVEEQGGVLDGSGHRAVDGQAVPRAVVRCERDPVPLRLDPEEAAPRRRDPDRPHAVGPQRHRSQSRRDRRAATAAAATRRTIGVPGFRVAPNVERFGERPEHHLGHRRLAEDDGARLTQSAGPPRRPRFAPARRRWCRTSSLRPRRRRRP